MNGLSGKLDALKDILSGYGKILVALSGGVDSVFLLVFAYDMWKDDRVMALTASGPQFTDEEVEYARQVCDNLGIGHKTVKVDHVLPLIQDNREDRCYVCKKEIFSVMKDRAEMLGRVLADGTNADDTDDYRPGMRALEELDIASPLKKAGLTKLNIRQALLDMAERDEVIKAALMTDIWDKPSSACLASRIPYGQRITKEKLEAVKAAEDFLHERGFSQVRVRHHGNIAKIEILPKERKFFDVDMMERVNDHIKSLGFDFAALDLAGYKTGSLNDTTDKHRYYTNDTDREYDFDDLISIIAQLRGPGGCPWDIKQTHESLKKCLEEESGEVITAIDNKDDENLCEELGDLMLQAVMHAQIASETGRFTMDDIIQGVCEKMVRRHPHVFGDEKVSSPEESLALWKEIKKTEKADD